MHTGILISAAVLFLFRIILIFSLFIFSGKSENSPFNICSKQCPGGGLAHLYSEHSGARGRQISVRLRPVCSTEPVPEKEGYREKPCLQKPYIKK